MQGFGIQKIHRNISQRNRKSVAMATLVARCCPKTNQLKSVQGFGMQRYPRKTFKPKKHKKALPGVAKKLISSNLYRGMENKEPIKIFVSKKKKRKSVAMATLVARCCRKANQLQSVQGYRKQRTHKNIYKSKKQKKCCHDNTCCQPSLKSLSAPIHTVVWSVKNSEKDF